MKADLPAAVPGAARASSDAPRANIQLNDIALFVEVARRGSFSLSAAALGVPPSTLSRRVSGLERDLGMQLLKRSTRKIGLTEAGALYFERCRDLIDEARVAHEQLQAGIRQYIRYYNHDRIKLKLKGLSPVQYRAQAFGL